MITLVHGHLLLWSVCLLRIANATKSCGCSFISQQSDVIGSGTVFAVIFAAHDMTTAQTFKATGPVAASVDSAPFNSLMTSSMVANGMRVEQLVIAVNGMNSLCRAYTSAESTYRRTQPSNAVSLASFSKIFLETAVQSLHDPNLIHIYSAVYPLMGLSNPTVTQQFYYDTYSSCWIIEAAVQLL